ELVLARREPAEAVAARLPVERRVDDRGAEAVAREPVHLVLHERDERAHHEDGARQETRRDLEGERLASAGRHDADAVPPAQDRVDDLLLSRAEALVAEDARQDVPGSRTGAARAAGPGHDPDPPAPPAAHGRRLRSVSPRLLSASRRSPAPAARSPPRGSCSRRRRSWGCRARSSRRRRPTPPRSRRSPPPARAPPAPR